MKTHRIISQSWQLKAAAEGTLGAIILPLPEGCISGSPETWPIKSLKCGFNESYRIYLAEEWCKFPGRLSTGEPPYYELRSNYPPLVMPSEKEEWQPAETMPEEAARHWFEITKVKVTQAKCLDYFTIGKTGFYNSYPDATYPSEEFKNAWDKAHPEHLWSGNLWVIVLEVKNI